MTYKIIGDSCSDFRDIEKNDSHLVIVPLTLQIGDYHVIDDEKFDQKAFIQRVNESPVGAKTACPSPQLFKEAYECDAEMVFAVTLSEHLSGTYQSAVLGKKLYEEEHGDNKNILVISSHSAAAGQLRIIIELKKLIAQELSFEEISRKILKLRDDMKTYFVIESLEPLRKNGRLSGMTAFFATALNIKPIMGTSLGSIVKLDQARGINKALSKMISLALKDTKNVAEETVVITSINNNARGQQVKKEFEEAGFKNVIVTEAMGVATVYAGDGGIIVGMA